jgi:hypothetical protein
LDFESNVPFFKSKRVGNEQKTKFAKKQTINLRQKVIQLMSSLEANNGGRIVKRLPIAGPRSHIKQTLRVIGGKNRKGRFVGYDIKNRRGLFYVNGMRLIKPDIRSRIGITNERTLQWY